MALGTSYSRNSRVRDLVLMAKLALVGQTPDLDLVERIKENLRKEFAPSTAKSAIRKIDNFQRKIG